MSRATVLLGFVLALVACGGESSPNPPPPPPPPGPAAIASVTFDQDSSAVDYTGTLQLTATPRDSKGNPLTGRTITWRSTAPEIASVSTSGLVTGNALGRAVVEATSDGITGRATIGVVPAWASQRTTMRTGQVQFPAAASLTPAGIRVQTSLGVTIPSAGGAFSLPGFSSGPQVVSGVATDGRPLLLGWLTSGGSTTLSSRSTAEALAYFDLAGPLLPPQGREFLIAELHRRGELDELTAAITAALSGPAGSATIDLPAVYQARRNVRSRLVPAALTARRTARGPNRVVSIDPLAPQSGLVVHESDLNIVWITNQFRRRGTALVDRISYIDVNGDSVPSLQRVATQEIAGVNGVTSFGGLLGDVVLGNLAWAEVENGPVALPISPADARSTRYRMRAFGLGPATQAELNKLTPADRQELDAVALKGLFLDLVFPFVMNVILDGSVKGDAIDDALREPGVATALSDCIGWISSTVPSVYSKVYAGDMRGAAEDIYTALLSSDSFQAFVFDFTAAVAVKLLSDPTRGAALRAVSDFAQSFLGFIGRVDLVLTGTDLALQFWQLGNVRAIETWDLVARPSKVKLNPPQSRIARTDILPLKALVLGLDSVAGGAALAYKWSTTGQNGTLVDATHRGNSFSSSSDVVTFSPNLQTSGTDQVTVEVSRVEAGVVVVIGTATASVEVGTVAIDLQPSAAVLEHRQQQTFVVQVPPALSAGATLSYRWYTTGNFGLLDRGQKSIQGAADRVTYTAGRDVVGTDEVAVEVLATKNGQTASLGTDRAQVQVIRAPFTIEPAVAVVAKDSVVRFVARPYGDYPAKARYRWNFDDGTSPVVVPDDSTISHAFHTDGRYTIGVDLEDAATGKRLATAAGSVTVGPVDTLPIWKITSLELVSLTGDIPDDSMEAHPTYATYGQYFYMMRKLERIRGGLPAYVHAIEPTALLPDCFDFDFDRDKTEQVNWGAWIWIQLPTEIPDWCGPDRVAGHYPMDESWNPSQGSSIMMGLDEVDFFRRFQNANIYDVWDYPGKQYATVTSNVLSGRRFAAYNSSSGPTPEKHQVYEANEIEAQMGQGRMTGTLRFVYQAYLGDDVVATWTATYEFEAVQGR
jgi:hypothetical protein